MIKESENEIEYELEKILNQVKNMFNLTLFNTKEKEKLNNNRSSASGSGPSQFNLLKNSSVYSAFNKELYVLLDSVDKNSDQLQYHLLSYSLDSNCIKSLKKLIFTFDQDIDKRAQMRVKNLYLHEDNENQICFFSEEYLGFIRDLKKETVDGQSDIKIKIIHSSLISEITSGSSSIFKYKKFAFSKYEDLFGVLYSNNSFSIYNIESKVNEGCVNNIMNQEIIDFSFGPVLEFGWINFSIFFLDINGGIHYICPVFPNETKISKSYIKKMKDFVRDIKIHERDREEEHILNGNIIYHLENSMSIKAGEGQSINHSDSLDDHLILKTKQYLKNFNKNELIASFKLNEKKKEIDIFQTVKSIYRNIYILKMYPLTILRIGYKIPNNNMLIFIDVISSNDDIIPVRVNGKLKQSYLIETILFKYDYMNNEVISQNQSENIFGIVSNKEKDNLLIGRNYKNCRDFSVYFYVLNDIYEISLPYLKILSEYFNHYKINKEVKLVFKSKIHNIIKFDYKDKSEMLVGYFVIQKMQKSFILITCSKSSFYAKDILYETKPIVDGHVVVDNILISNLIYSNSNRNNNILNFNNFKKFERSTMELQSITGIEDVNKIDFLRLEKLINKL